MPSRKPALQAHHLSLNLNIQDKALPPTDIDKVDGIGGLEACMAALKQADTALATQGLELPPSVTSNVSSEKGSTVPIVVQEGAKKNYQPGHYLRGRKGRGRQC